MTSINTASPLFNDNELNKILNELSVEIKDKPLRSSRLPLDDLPARSPSGLVASGVEPVEGTDARPVEDILRENFKID
jgi:hypothetical protein